MNDACTDRNDARQDELPESLASDPARRGDLPGGLRLVEITLAEARALASLVQDLATLPPDTGLVDRVWSFRGEAEDLGILPYTRARASERLAYLNDLVGEEYLSTSRAAADAVVARIEAGADSCTIELTYPYPDSHSRAIDLAVDIEDESGESRLEAELTEDEVAALYGFWWRGEQGVQDLLSWVSYGRFEPRALSRCGTRMEDLAPHLGEEFHLTRARAEAMREVRRERLRREMDAEGTLMSLSGASPSAGVGGDEPDTETRRQALRIMNGQGDVDPERLVLPAWPQG